MNYRMQNKLTFTGDFMLVLVTVQLLLLGSVDAQNMISYPNPGGSTTGYAPNSGPYSPQSTPVVLNNILYGLSTDNDGKGRLSKFDGVTITLVPRIGADFGFGGSLIVFDNAIYAHYVDANKSTRVAKYDGEKVVLLTNPPAFTSMRSLPIPTFFIFNNTLYGRFMDDQLIWRLVKISDASAPANAFSITGVTVKSCTAISANKKILVFAPQYTGQSGQPVTFSAQNELAATTNPGPYSINLYTDNPTIMLKATQAGTPGEASYAFNWLASCGRARQEATEQQEELSVTAMPNPSSEQTIRVMVKGAGDQPVTFRVTDEGGNPVSELHLEKIYATEQETVRLGFSPGIYILKVITPTQARTLKIIKK